MFDDTPSSNPFPGLRPFEAHENHLFFGRDGQSDDLLHRLSRQRFIAVVGTSGSGKSSLVRAGLLPALHGGFMLRAGSNWSVAIFRPGSNPIGHLAQALSRDAISSNDNVDEAIRLSIMEASLRRSALGLIDVVRQARMNPQDNLLIVVDQFEELFRVRAKAGATGSDDAAAFVKLLLEATCQSELPIYVLITMRSDFLGDCSQFRDLPEAINDGQYLIPRMTRDQRREAITGPAAVGGAQIAPRLVNRLLNDVGDNPDQLPLLQHALMRMWQQWEKDADQAAPLDLSHYETIGGLNEAISQHADEAYDELKTDRSRRVAEILFKLLTERGSDNREIRRPTRLAEVCAVAEADESEVLSVIKGFRREGRSFLMPPPSTMLRPNSFIDISHESLIRGWRRLQRWVDDEALSARIYRRLAETAALHRAGEASLWRDPDLAIALTWRDKNHPNVAWGERYSPDFDEAMKFLDESRRARDAERLEHERTRRRTLRLMQALAAVFLVGLCVSLALGAFAYHNWNRAIEQTRQAKESARQAQDSEQRAKEAGDAARREKDRAEESAKLAQQAEAKAKESALLAERNAEQARQNLEVAEAANKKLLLAEAATRKALNEAVLAKERAEREEQVAIDARERANNLRLKYRRESIEANAHRLNMAQRLEQISPAEERAYWKIQQADAWASLGNKSGAIRLFDSVLSEDPGNFMALSARGTQYLISKDPEKALPDIEKSLNINDKLPMLYLNKALGLSYLGRYEEAIEEAQKGIAVSTNLGYEKYATRDLSEEVENLTGQKTISADGDEMLTVLYYDKASLAASSGSKNFSSHLAAADARPFSTEAYVYALNLSLLNSKVRPQDYGVLVAQGILWERAGYCDKAKEAYEAFREAHEREPQSRYNYLAVWVANNAQGSLSSRKGRCRNVSQNEKTQRDYLLDMLEYAWSGDAIKAENILKTALKDAGDNPDFLLERMVVRYFLTGDYAGAKEDSEKLISMGKGTAAAYLVHAMANTQLNASDASIVTDVLEAKRLNPARVFLVYDSGDKGTNGKALVEVIAKTNRDEAIDFLKRSIQYNPPSAYARYLLAKLLNDKGSFKEALAQINIAIALDRTRLDYFDVKRRAEAGLSNNVGAVNATNLNPTLIQRNKFTDYSNAGDTFSLNGQTVTALSAYGESLKALNEIAGQAKNAEDVKCEVAATVQKVFNLLKAQGSKDDAVLYINTLYGNLNNIFPLIQGELKKLSAAP